MQLVSWVDGGRERVVQVEDGYDALAVAKAIAAEVGAEEVYVAGKRVTGKPSGRDWEEFDRFQKGEPRQREGGQGGP